MSGVLRNKYIKKEGRKAEKEISRMVNKVMKPLFKGLKGSKRSMKK